jgi:hypothetical protein
MTSLRRSIRPTWTRFTQKVEKTSLRGCNRIKSVEFRMRRLYERDTTVLWRALITVKRQTLFK